MPRDRNTAPVTEENASQVGPSTAPSEDTGVSSPEAPNIAGSPATETTDAQVEQEGRPDVKVKLHSDYDGADGTVHVEIGSGIELDLTPGETTTVSAEEADLLLETNIVTREDA